MADPVLLADRTDAPHAPAARSGRRGASRPGAVRARRREAAWGLAFIAPNLLGLAVFYLWPIVQNLWFSFTEWSVFGAKTFAGLANYVEMVGDRELWRAFGHTGLYALMVVPGSIVAALALAVLLARRSTVRSVYRVILLLPMVTMPAATALIWKWLLNSDYGLVNAALEGVGLGTRVWLAGPLALVSVAVVGVWSTVGYNIVILLAGLDTIDSSLYEAAAIDGAGRWTTLTRITLPLLTPSIFFLTVTSLINALQVFDLIFMMIGPTNPAIRVSQSVVYYFYDVSFVSGAKGYGASIAVVLFLVILLITVVQLRLQRRWVFYAS